jgi:hypothetical protein
LSFESSTYKPFTQVPGAVEADGTKAYAGEYSHGVVAVSDHYYFQLVYATTQPAQVPFEFYNWVKTQYVLLQPPSSSATTSVPATTSPSSAGG